MEHASIEFILILEWIMSLDPWDPVRRLGPWRLACHWCNPSAVVHGEVENLCHFPFPKWRVSLSTLSCLDLEEG